MKKTYKVKVRSRNRITVPLDCWLDVGKMTQLKLRCQGLDIWWDPCVGMTKSMSYRVAVPFEVGTELELIPDKENKIIRVSKIWSYNN